MCSLTGRQGPCKSSRGGLLQGGKNGPVHHHRNIGGSVANIFRLILLSLAVFCGLAFSAVQPVYQYSGSYWGGGVFYSTAQAACDASAANRGAALGADYSGFTGVMVDQYNCSIGATEKSTGTYYPNWGGDAIYQSGTPVCPANSTSDGSGGCTCSSGYSESGGQCVDTGSDKARCDTWSALNGTLGGLFTQEAQRFTGTIADGAVFCSPVEGLSSPTKGCKMAFEWSASYGYGDTKVTEGKFISMPDTDTVDTSCTPGDSNSPPTLPPTQEKCKDGYTGQVNGVDVCVSVRPDSGVGSTGTTTSTNNGTETQDVTTQNQTQCANGVCTTTTTTTTTTTNNSTGASTTNTTTANTSQSQDGFCLANEDSKLCSDGTEDGSSFTGSCTTEFVCEGDAIQCAIAREQHKRACKMFDDESPESKLYEDNKGKEGNQTGDLPDNETISLSGRINTTDALGAGSAGVSDLQVTVWGQSISLPFSQINPYLAHLGNVLLAVSFLMAVRIVARG